MTRIPTNGLEFTGERFTPECVREIWYEHVHRYVLAAEWVRNKTVLDAACGEGYGSHYLAGRARRVSGVDISAEAVDHARQRYRADNLEFFQADCRKLPFAGAQFDCIVSFETLEHLEEQEQLLAEFRRVLAADGFLLISSPDKAVYSRQLGNENPFHVRELYRHELEDLLATHFPAVRLLGQKLAFNSMIWPLDAPPGPGDDPAARPPGFTWQRENQGTAASATSPAGDAVYYLALCAAEDRFLPPSRSCLWLFDDAAESVYRHYHHEIRKNMQAGEVLMARDSEIETLKAALKAAEDRIQASWWRRLVGGT